ncbi:MAG: DUF2974 domain-containing protein [Lachnospiraceae bacterium]|jgi:hypothetical protein|uniref:DUF2974 domain-containing protein n=1 Tax=Candidatus Merdisoma sp. JLR.KK006 TaxID=3112626 RepID=UPI002FF23376|nr:DUF2974 domain-containing protein [Lachnospiraceae bacterium]
MRDIMANMLDYIAWRGDLPFSQSPVSPVDGLILSTLSYIQFDNMLSNNPHEAITLSELSQMFLELSEEAVKSRLRTPKDAELIQALGESRRFGSLRLTAAEELLDEEKELQFAAITLLLEDGSAFVVFRGTDGTLTGWKEDLNLSFLDEIPGQRAARDYLEKIAGIYPGRLYAAGHSKGGNLAVYAAIRCEDHIRDRIQAVYNYDGPGFLKKVLADPGYREILSRVHTFVPQSSVVGMLLEHEEPYTVVHSTEEGLLQHEPYSWEVQGSGFAELRKVTAGSRMVDETIKDWLAGLSAEERKTFIDALYEVLKDSDVKHIGELAEPKKIYAALQKLGQEDVKTKVMLAGVLIKLIKSIGENFSQI